MKFGKYKAWILGKDIDYIINPNFMGEMAGTVNNFHATEQTTL